MEKKDSAPPSPLRSPASGSPTAHSAGQASPFSPNTRSCSSPSRQELFSPGSYSTASRATFSRQGPGDDDSPRNLESPVKFRSLEDIYASTHPIEESSGAKVPPRLGTRSPRIEKFYGADSYGGSLKLRIKVPRQLGIQSPREAKSSGVDFHSPGPFRSPEDIDASTHPIEESSGAKVPPRLGTHSPRTEKLCGADSYGGSLKLRIKVLRQLGIQSPREAKRSGADFHSPGPFTNVSSLGNQEKESSAPSQHHQERSERQCSSESPEAGDGQRGVPIESWDDGTSSGGPVGFISRPGEPSRDATETSGPAQEPRKKVRFRDPIIENEW